MSLAVHTLLLVVLALWVLPQISARSVERLQAWISSDPAELADFVLITSQQPPDGSASIDDDQPVPIPELLPSPTAPPLFDLDVIPANPVLDIAKGGGQPPYEEWTKDELYDRAQELDIEGRSDMDKDELIAALRNG